MTPSLGLTLHRGTGGPGRHRPSAAFAKDPPTGTKQALRWLSIFGQIARYLKAILSAFFATGDPPTLQQEMNYPAANSPGPIRWSKVMVFAVLLFPSLGWGALTWENQKVELTARLGDKEAVGLFPFKNTGQAAVTITDIHTSCECTVAELPKRTYAAGETGVIRAVFTLGDRMGPQDRLVTVTTNDPTAPQTMLTLRVDIPDRLSYSSRMLHWSVGGSGEAKTVEISAIAGNRLTAIEVREIAPKQATARIDVIEAGRKYRLIIQPSRLDGPWTIAVTCVAKFEDGGQHSLLVYALVR